MAGIRLSNEVDENGYNFVLAQNGDIVHGDQIRNAGFSSVAEFVEYVATNYKRKHVKKGKTRNYKYCTYIIYTEQRNCHVLFIELSKGRSYWNVNSGGIFRNGYLLKKENVGTETELPKFRPTTPE